MSPVKDLDEVLGQGAPEPGADTDVLATLQALPGGLVLVVVLHRQAREVPD